MEYWLWIAGGAVFVYVMYRASRGGHGSRDSGGFWLFGGPGDSGGRDSGGGDFGGGDSGCWKAATQSALLPPTSVAAKTT